MPTYAGDRIHLGQIIGAQEEDKRVFYDSPVLLPHKDKPWLVQHIKDRSEIDLAKITSTPRHFESTSFSVPAERENNHILLLGTSGKGKTLLSLHLLREQLKRGCSAVVLDIKPETIQQVIAVGLEAGLGRNQITTVYPGEHRTGVPGWNPFVGDGSEVKRFVDIIKEITPGDFGSRMDAVFKCATTVIAYQKLSLVELIEFLQNDVYRLAILQRAKAWGIPDEYEYQHEYFVKEFRNLTPGERSTTISAVISRIRDLVTVPYLKAMLTAERDTLDLAGMWKTQRLVAVHLDSGSLTNDGVRLLSGMLSSQLFRIAMQKPGNVPVVLMIDEAGFQQKSGGDTLVDILTVARQQGLRMLAATQELGKLPEGLRESLLTNSALRIFFQLGDKDASLVADFLSKENRTDINKVSITAVPDVWDKAYLPLIVKEGGKGLRLSQLAWQAMKGTQTVCHNEQWPADRLIKALQKISLITGKGKVLAKAPDGKWYMAEDLVHGLPSTHIYLTGPDPVGLMILYPRPVAGVLKKVNDTQRKAQLQSWLLTIPRQTAVVRENGSPSPTYIRTTDVTFPYNLPRITDFLVNGQSGAQITATAAKRKEQMTRLSVVPIEVAPMQQAVIIKKPTQKPSFAQPKPKGKQLEDPTLTPLVYADLPAEPVFFDDDF